jgi:hypothetical protein
MRHSAPRSRTEFVAIRGITTPVLDALANVSPGRKETAEPTSGRFLGRRHAEDVRESLSEHL